MHLSIIPYWKRLDGERNEAEETRVNEHSDTSIFFFSKYLNNNSLFLKIIGFYPKNRQIVSTILKQIYCTSF